jgi:hypothetical protein
VLTDSVTTTANKVMKHSTQRDQQEFAKMMAAACVRRGYLEKLHAGITPVSRTGDYSDVKVIDADGREIPWHNISRINDEEMKTLMTGIVDRIYTFLARTLFAPADDAEFARALDRAALPWTKGWSDPKYQDEFLMPPRERP